MNKNSNSYTIIYAAVMVILVAIGLGFTAQSLKAPQKNNENIDKMQQILSALNIEASQKEAIETYNKVITNAYLVDKDGNIIEGTNGKEVNSPAFVLPLSALKKANGYPVFEANINGEVKHIFPMYGAGLWGPLWGYISVDEDNNTIYGANFSHQGETPGLGAEITKEQFYSQFPGKKIYQNGEFKSIAVVKPGKSAAGKDYVDGISGGTLTSNGVDEMLYESLKLYDNYLKKKH